LPSAPPPDGSEVVEVFSGDTLEEAMAAAVAALGPDLAVRRARKVRSGVRGLLGKDRYEVLAAPSESGRPAPVAYDDEDGDAVGSAFEALMNRAEEQDSMPAATPARPRAGRRAAPPPPAVPVEDDRWTPPPAARTLQPVPDEPLPVRGRRPGQAAAPAAPARRTRRATDAPHPQPDVAEHEVAPPFQEHPEPSPRPAPVPPPVATPVPPRPARRSAAPAVGTWSKAALTRLGVPDAVLAELDPPAATDDLGWVVALTSAIAATVPEPGAPDEKNPVVVSGHGLPGVLAILDAGSRGLRPGTITTGGRTAPATATELALVVRAHVVGGG
jgi:hypothetical protein